ncbi:MAG: hypothetical protein EON94_03685, partial [Caulobacteraceae bacterium]
MTSRLLAASALSGTLSLAISLVTASSAMAQTVALNGPSAAKTPSQTYGGGAASAVDVQAGYWTQTGVAVTPFVTIEAGASFETIAIDGPNSLIVRPAFIPTEVVVDGTLILTTNDINVYNSSGFQALSGSGVVDVVGGG